MAGRLKFGNVLLCEHVVEGSRNKHTLVNVYSGDVIVSSMPAAMLFGIYMEYSAHKSGNIEISMDLRVGSKKLVTLKVGANDVQKGGSITFALPVFQVLVEEDTVLELIASTEGYQKTKVLSKKITKAELAP